MTDEVTVTASFEMEIAVSGNPLAKGAKANEPIADEPMADEASWLHPKFVEGPDGEFLGWYDGPNPPKRTGTVGLAATPVPLPEGWKPPRADRQQLAMMNRQRRALRALLQRVRHGEGLGPDLKPEYFRGMALGYDWAHGPVSHATLPLHVATAAHQHLQALFLELADALEAQQGAQPDKPTVPNAFTDERGVISSSLAAQGVLASLYAAQDGEQGWRNGEDNMPAFDFAQSQGTVRVLMRPESDTLPSQAIADALWNQVRQFSDKDGDVLLAMMAQAMEPGRMDTDGATWITAPSILDYRGVRPIMKRDGKALRRAGHRVEDMAEIAACVDRLGSQWIELIAVETREPRTGKRQPKVTRTSYESKLLTIEERFRQGDLGGQQHAIAWRYRLGRCITEFLSAPNRQVARLMRCVLEYDPYRHSFEKRLGRYFTIHHRISASYKAPLRRKVGGLFSELCLPVNGGDPSKTLRRFETAMDRLVSDGVLPGWRYTPESTARINALPARRWLPDWLTCVVEVPTPKAALEAPADG